MRSCVLLSLLISIVCAQNHTAYIEPNGSGGGDCTRDEPCSFMYAQGHMPPFSTYVFLAGNYAAPLTICPCVEHVELVSDEGPQKTQLGGFCAFQFSSSFPECLCGSQALQARSSESTFLSIRGFSIRSEVDALVHDNQYESLLCVPHDDANPNVLTLEVSDVKLGEAAMVVSMDPHGPLISVALRDVNADLAYFFGSGVMVQQFNVTRSTIDGMYGFFEDATGQVSDVFFNTVNVAYSTLRVSAVTQHVLSSFTMINSSFLFSQTENEGTIPTMFASNHAMTVADCRFLVPCGRVLTLLDSSSLDVRSTKVEYEGKMHVVSGGVISTVMAARLHGHASDLVVRGEQCVISLLHTGPDMFEGSLSNVTAVAHELIAVRGETNGIQPKDSGAFSLSLNSVRLEQTRLEPNGNVEGSFGLYHNISLSFVHVHLVGVGQPWLGGLCAISTSVSMSRLILNNTIGQQFDFSCANAPVQMNSFELIIDDMLIVPSKACAGQGTGAFFQANHYSEILIEVSNVQSRDVDVPLFATDNCERVRVDASGVRVHNHCSSLLAAHCDVMEFDVKDSVMEACTSDFGVGAFVRFTSSSSDILEESEGVPLNIRIRNSTFRDNFAVNAGGLLYLTNLHADEPKADEYVSFDVDEKSIFVNNTAQFWGDVKASAPALVQQPQLPFYVTTAPFTLCVQLFDLFGQLMAGTSTQISSQIVLLLRSSTQSAGACWLPEKALSKPAVPAGDGFWCFKSLVLHGLNGSTAAIDASLNGASSAIARLEATISNGCPAGHVLSIDDNDGAESCPQRALCTLCPAGTYSLIGDKCYPCPRRGDEESDCARVPKNHTFSGVYEYIVDAGFQMTDTSDGARLQSCEWPAPTQVCPQLLCFAFCFEQCSTHCDPLCPVGESTCPTTCANGYEDRLCSKCACNADECFYNADDRACLPCSTDSDGAAIVVTVLAAALFLLSTALSGRMAQFVIIGTMVLLIVVTISSAIPPRVVHFFSGVALAALGSRGVQHLGNAVIGPFLRIFIFFAQTAFQVLNLPSIANSPDSQFSLSIFDMKIQGWQCLFPVKSPVLWLTLTLLAPTIWILIVAFMSLLRLIFQRQEACRRVAAIGDMPPMDWEHLLTSETNGDRERRASTANAIKSVNKLRQTASVNSSEIDSVPAPLLSASSRGGSSSSVMRSNSDSMTSFSFFKSWRLHMLSGIVLVSHMVQFHVVVDIVECITCRDDGYVKKFAWIPCSWTYFEYKQLLIVGVIGLVIAAFLIPLIWAYLLFKHQGSATSRRQVHSPLSFLVAGVRERYWFADIVWQSRRVLLSISPAFPPFWERVIVILALIGAVFFHSLRPFQARLFNVLEMVSLLLLLLTYAAQTSDVAAEATTRMFNACVVYSMLVMFMLVFIYIAWRMRKGKDEAVAVAEARSLLFSAENGGDALPSRHADNE